jgi:hypothetical protein
MSRRPSRASVDGLDTFDHIFAQWIEAEARGDADALDALLDLDFRGDDPSGIVLTKQEWLDRPRANGSFAWEDVHVRPHGDTVVARGIQVQAGGKSKATLVAVRRDGRWSIVNLQLSALEDDS